MWVGVLAVLLAGSLIAGAQANAGVGRGECLLVDLEGKVEVSAKGGNQWTLAQTNLVLNIGDRLRTGLRSRATLQWSGLSVMRVNQLTTMEISAPAQPDGPAQLNLQSGATYLFSREKPSTIQFQTPVASGAIRGTEFGLSVAEGGQTVLTLLDGAVDLKNAQGRLTLNSGEQATVDQSGPPRKTAVIDALGTIQWALYYPAVVDPAEIGMSRAEQDALADSLAAYRTGDLLGALKSYPEQREPGSEAERIFHAALLLAVGQVEQAQADLDHVNTASGPVKALREIVWVVKGHPPESLSVPDSGSEAVARSYTLQLRSQLPAALEAARLATKKSPAFGAGWVRVAELEFSFGRTTAALAALEQGLKLSPRNAEGMVLKGFLLIAAGRMIEAGQWFDQAIAADGALGNAWLGRGLLKIRNGRVAEGRADLQVAATLEPQRAVLRSYLGKAFAWDGDRAHAEKELALGKQLDPNDPTAWLYDALLLEDQSRLNEAAGNLEKSKELNGNRSVFRSALLLDQDQAVRSANLAAIYRDLGIFDVGVQEAAKAANDDFANASAHQFLAASYDNLSDPNHINLRYETAAFSEYLLANLLAPADGAGLAQNISQQEYSRLFTSDHLGLYSDSEYASHGDYSETASQYGVLGNTSYSLNGLYRANRGFRPNNGLTNGDYGAQLKQQLTPSDSIYFEASTFEQHSGDLSQYYNQSQASTTEQVTERQTPNLLVGYHHEWAPGIHTLLLGTRFSDILSVDDTAPQLLFLRTQVNLFTGTTNTSVINPPFYSLAYTRELTAYSAELEQIWETGRQTLVLGGRLQDARFNAYSELDRNFVVSTPITAQNFAPNLHRYSLYAYEYWHILDQLQVVAGVAFDSLEYPLNIDTSPITNTETSTSRVSPKAGIVWTPWKDTEFRAFYTRSLGGESLDSSVRLEPTQIAGFNQAFRSLIPESVEGLVPGTRFETFGLGWNQRFSTRTYVVLDGEILKSRGVRTVGILTNSSLVGPIADTASSTRESLNYTENSITLTVNQMLGKTLTLGARYQVTESELDAQFQDIPAATPGVPNQDVSATLQQVRLYGIWNHPSGLFAEADGVWSEQWNRGYSPGEPGDSFWQANIYLGYRFWNRRAEARIGLLNVADRDYRLNPLTLYNELPRERNLVASFKVAF